VALCTPAYCVFWHAQRDVLLGQQATGQPRPQDAIKELGVHLWRDLLLLCVILTDTVAALRLF